MGSVPQGGVCPTCGIPSSAKPAGRMQVRSNLSIPGVRAGGTAAHLCTSCWHRPPSVVTSPPNASLNIWHCEKSLFLCFTLLGWHASKLKVQELCSDGTPVLLWLWVVHHGGVGRNCHRREGSTWLGHSPGRLGERQREDHPRARVRTRSLGLCRMFAF